LREVEEPLFKAVLAYVEGNQSRAADVLGINRARSARTERLRIELRVMYVRQVMKADTAELTRSALPIFVTSITHITFHHL